MNLRSERFIVGMSIALFVVSLTQDAFCTPTSCAVSWQVFLTGVLGMLMGLGKLLSTGGLDEGTVAVFTWIANPLIWASWFFFIKKEIRWSLVASLMATAISLSFLAFGKILHNEAGQSAMITSVQSGYVLWVASAITIFFGSIVRQR